MKPPQIVLVAEMRESPIAIHRYLQPPRPVVVDLVRPEYRGTIDFARGQDVTAISMSNCATNYFDPPKQEPPKGRAPFRKFFR